MQDDWSTAPRAKSGPLPRPCATDHAKYCAATPTEAFVDSTPGAAHSAKTMLVRSLSVAHTMADPNGRSRTFLSTSLLFTNPLLPPILRSPPVTLNWTGPSMTGPWIVALSAKITMRPGCGTVSGCNAAPHETQKRGPMCAVGCRRMGRLLSSTLHRTKRRTGLQEQPFCHTWDRQRLAQPYGLAAQATDIRRSCGYTRPGSPTPGCQAPVECAARCGPR